MGNSGEPHFVWIKRVALKREKVGQDGENAMTALSNEGDLLSNLHRKGIGFPKVEEMELRPDSVTIVYECVLGNTFGTVFGRSGRIDTPVDSENAKSLLRVMPSLCRQLVQLHQEGYAHRNIEPETLLLNKKGKKLGLLRDVGLATEPFHAGEGPTGYAAPEQHHDGYHLPGTDIYQLGAVIYHLLTGKIASSFLFEIAPPNRFNRELPQEP